MLDSDDVVPGERDGVAFRFMLMVQYTARNMFNQDFGKNTTQTAQT